MTTPLTDIPTELEKLLEEYDFQFIDSAEIEDGAVIHDWKRIDAAKSALLSYVRKIEERMLTAEEAKALYMDCEGRVAGRVQLQSVGIRPRKAIPYRRLLYIQGERMISRAHAELLAHLQHGGWLKGTRTFPTPWHYKDREGREYSEATIIKLVTDGLLRSYSNKPDEINFNITPKGIEAERGHIEKRAKKRERGG